jgi:hypothetical protein
MTPMTDADQYRKRDAAWAHHLEHKINSAAQEWRVAQLQAAFNAGWEARKRAEVETMLEGMRRPQKPGDPAQALRLHETATDGRVLLHSGRRPPHDDTDGRTDR